MSDIFETQIYLYNEKMKSDRISSINDNIIEKSFSYQQNNSSTFEEEIRSDSVAYYKNQIKELQIQNFNLKAQINGKELEHTKILKEKMNQLLETHKIQINQLKNDNLTLNKLNKILEEESQVLHEQIKAMKNFIESTKKKQSNYENQIFHLKSLNNQLKNLFKNFENQDIHQSINQLIIYKELTKKNIQLIKEEETILNQKIFEEYKDSKQKMLAEIKTLKKQIQSNTIYKQLVVELQNFKKMIPIRKFKNVKNCKRVFQVLLSNLQDEQQNVLDQRFNSHKRRINKLQGFVIKLVNMLQAIPELDRELKDVKKEMTQFKNKIDQDNKKMFDRAVDSIFKSRQSIVNNKQNHREQNSQKATNNSKSITKKGKKTTINNINK